MNEVTYVLNHPWTHRIGWGLLHSLWQGAVAAVVFALLRAVLRGRSANARYLAGCAILLGLALAPMVTACLARGTANSLLVPSEPAKGSWFDTATANYAGDSAVFANRAGRLEAWQRSAAGVERVMPWLVLAWVAGVAGCSWRWVRGSWWLRSVKKVGTEPVEERWLTKLDQLKERLNISRPVRLLKSTLLEVPIVVGWLRPVILLPASTISGLTPAQLEAILAHELVHIRRLDYVVNAFQNLLETLMFYHPAVWWISRCTREERELCCDDQVVRLCADRVVYARALYTLEVLRGHPRLAFAASGGSLLARVRRLLGTGGDTRSPGGREFSGFMLVGIGCVLIAVGAILIGRQGIFQAQALVRIEPEVRGLGLGSPAQTAPAYYNPYFVATELAMIRSPVVLNLVLKQAPGGTTAAPLPANRLRSQLALRPVPGTSLVGVIVSDQNASEAARLANRVARAYQEYRAEQGSRLRQDAHKRLEVRIEDLDRELSAAQEKAEKLRVEKGLPVAIANKPGAAGENASASLTAETLRRIESLRIESEAELVRQQKLLEVLGAVKGDELPQVITAAIQDPVMVSLQEQLNVAEQKLVGLSNDFGPNHSECIKLSSQIRDLQSKLRQRADGVMAGLSAKVASMKEGLKRLQEEVEQAKVREIDLAKRAAPYLGAERKIEELQRFRQVLMDKLASEPLYYYEQAVELVEEAVAPLKRTNPDRDMATAVLAAGLLSACVGIWLARSGQHMSGDAVPA